MQDANTECKTQTQQIFELTIFVIIIILISTDIIQDIQQCKIFLLFLFPFLGHYYKMAGPEELDQFLKEPQKYVPPLAPRKLPPPELLPIRRTSAEVKAMFPVQIQLKGYCPVTYLDGKCRYEAIVPGNNELVVEYRGKIYFLESEEKLDKFMR